MMTMQSNFSNIEVLIVDPLESSKKKLVDISGSIDGVKTVAVTTAKEALNHLFFGRSEIVLLSLKLHDADGFETAKKIKEIYPKTIIIALVTFMDSHIEKELKKHGISGYIGKPIVETGRIKYRILNYVNHIRAGKQTEKLITSQKALNPFSSEIRSIKTTISIANDEEMMDFGLWLIERYMVHNQTQGIKFNRSLDLLYGTISYAIKHHTTTTVLIEENFDALFLSVPLYKAPKHHAIADRFASSIGENIRISDDHLFLKIALRQDEKKSAKREDVVIAGDHTKEMLRKSHTDKLSAINYVQTLSDVDLDEMRDLADIEERLDETISDFRDGFSLEKLHEISQFITSYSSKINALYEFSTLGYALSSLGLIIGNIKDIELENIDPKKLGVLLLGIYEDISKWRETIFISKSTQDVHYLDSSMLSSCMQIEAIVLNIVDSKESSDDELELF